MKLLRTKDLSWYSPDAWRTVGGPAISPEVGIRINAFPELEPYTTAWTNIQLSKKLEILEQIFIPVMMMLAYIVMIYISYTNTPTSLSITIPFGLLIYGMYLYVTYQNYIKAKWVWWKLK